MLQVAASNLVSMRKTTSESEIASVPGFADASPRKRKRPSDSFNHEEVIDGEDGLKTVVVEAGEEHRGSLSMSSSGGDSSSSSSSSVGYVANISLL